MEKIKAVIEALIFASDTPLSPERIRAVFPEVEKTEIREIIDQLVSEYHDRQGEFSCRKLRAVFNSAPIPISACGSRSSKPPNRSLCPRRR